MKQPQDIYRFEICLSGTGGQGVITLGRILGYGLAIGHGYNVAQTQSYGPEARGGASRADLVISSSEISYPKTESVDLLVALSQEACNKYYRNLKRDGVLLVDTVLVKQAPTNVFLGLPFTDLAKKRIKNPMTLNMIAMGAITHLLPFAEARVIRKAMLDNLPAKIHELNKKAFNLGINQAKKEFGEETPEIWAQAAQHADEEEIDALE